MRNAQGGKIAVGDWLLWCLNEETLQSMSHHMIVRVAKVEEPSIVGNNTPPTLHLLFAMPIDVRKMRPGEEPQLRDFFGLSNPNPNDEQKPKTGDLLKN